MSNKPVYNTEISGSFSTEEIILQSKRILAHPSFINSQILSKFLEFIITEAIHNREQQIKEYSIAVNVLKRPHDFNPHEDAIVRIHAGRLRRALSEYYFTIGINDPIIIHISKGSYIPHFCRPEDKKRLVVQADFPVSNEASDNPIVAIFPFGATPDNRELHEFSSELGEHLLAEFSRFSKISLIGYYSRDLKSKIEENILDAGKMIGANFILTGTIQLMDNYIRIHINFLNAQTGRILMAKYFHEEFTHKAQFDLIDSLAKSIMNTLTTMKSMIFLASIDLIGLIKSIISQEIFQIL
jgi:TolB-like protein